MTWGTGGLGALALNEETVFVEMDLPEGSDWSWHGDLNVVVLREGLTCEAKLAALDDLQRWWKRSHLKVVQGA